MKRLYYLGVVLWTASPNFTALAWAEPLVSSATIAIGTSTNGVPLGLTSSAAAAVESSSVAKPLASLGVSVRGRRRPDSRGAGDFFQEVGALSSVPVQNATDLLRLAPGIMLTNEGGEGHAERIYLRGFDAREGQDLEMSVNGVPINEVGNPHADGYADAHFIIPELVQAVRVLEGPFDPRQGNYGVAGSADYVLGLGEGGTQIQYSLGSFGTQRLLGLWSMGGSGATFAGVDLGLTEGYGSNRSARHGRAMAQAQLRLGEDTTLQILGTSYATQYGSAGVLRDDDVEAGRVDFYGTYDPTQGGDAARHGASLTLENRADGRTFRQQLSLTLRDFRLRSNLTGFLEDPPEAYRSGVAQRGDGIDQSYQATTLVARGSFRQKTVAFDRAQSLELGYFARLDRADSAQRRLRFGTIIPYRIDFDLGQTISNLALYADLELRPLPKVLLRGGLRGDYLQFNVENRCDLHDTVLSSAVNVIDELCYDQDRLGPRDPRARRTASGLIFQPRASLFLGPWADLTLALSAGTGARAADPAYLGQGNNAPFASIVAAEAGLLYSHRGDDFEVNARALYYYTYVSRDLIFSQQEGRATLAPGTRRQGAIGALRLTSSWLDWSTSLTFARARFDQEAIDPGVSSVFNADSGDRVPFIADWVFRSDAALHGPLPWPLIDGHHLFGHLSLGVSYVSPRALLYREEGQHTLLVDVALGLRWRAFELGLELQNLLDARYRLSELNYVSEFRPDTKAPNLVPARHFSAGPPLSVLASITYHFGDDLPEPNP